ncbi:MAG: hypothetical protein HRT90_10365 [Candidatus Margulisbacteria bacterium]|nr:hypothetical protein [Candidatus Margulisiibacteriota bacterium]
MKEKNPEQLLGMKKGLLQMICTKYFVVLAMSILVFCGSSGCEREESRTIVGNEERIGTIR